MTAGPAQVREDLAREDWGLIAYALAWAGGAIAYMPFLNLLLPLRFSELAGAQDLNWLGLTALLGAISASLASILFGWLSDLYPGRLRWSAGGIAALGLSYFAITRAATPAALVGCVVIWQFAVNLYLAPLGAYAAENVADGHRGKLGGMLSWAPGISALALLAIAQLPEGFALRVLAIPAIVLMMFLPLVMLAGRDGRAPAAPAPQASRPPAPRKTLLLLWLARFFVQISEALLFAFVFYFLRDLLGGHLGAADYALINAGVYLAAIPVALGIGIASDRRGARRGPLLAMIIVLALGFGIMGSSADPRLVIAAYVLCVIGSTVFLSLHSAFVMRYLPRADRLGRDLGFVNLSNTLPSIFGAPLALLVVPAWGYSGLLLLLAVSMALPAVLISRLSPN